MYYLRIDFGKKQQYIFGSNKLVANLGASYLIEHVLLKQLIYETIESCFGCINTIESYWQNDNPELFASTHDKVGILNIGGGSAFLVFETKGDREKFVMKYSKKILLEGYEIPLELGFFDDKDNAYSQNKTITDFNSIRDALHKSHLQRKQRQFLPYKIPNLGYVDLCPASNGHLEIGKTNSTPFILKKGQKENYQKQLMEELKVLLKNTNCMLSDSINDYNPEETSQYTSIVHIDGNNIGEYFATISTLAELRKKSNQMKQALNGAKKACYEHLVWLGDRLLKENKELHQKIFAEDNNKYILPLRFIVNAGDDITFITHGKLAFYLARIYMDEFARHFEAKDNISACAGIVINNTKAPFFRMYQLASELTNRAKKFSRIDGKPYVDFEVRYNSHPVKLDDLYRKNADKFKFIYKPICVFNNGAFDEFQLFLKDLNHFKNIISSTKQHELRKTIMREDAEEINRLKRRWIAKGIDVNDEMIHQKPVLDFMMLAEWLPEEIYLPQVTNPIS